MNEGQSFFTILNPRSFVGIFSDYEFLVENSDFALWVSVSDEANFGNFTSLFSRGRLRNVHIGNDMISSATGFNNHEKIF